MSFDYLYDDFGKFRKRETRFTELEKKAAGLLSAFVNRTMDNRTFAQSFLEVRGEFNKLMKVDGRLVIDEDTPLWLNMLLGFHFKEWLEFNQVRWYFEDHPEELKGESKQLFEELERRDFDGRFRKTCQYVLKELKVKQSSNHFWNLWKRRK